MSVVSIDNTNIQGNLESGSMPIYMSSPNENYIRYLREGLVETIVHEMLHRLVDHRRSYEQKFNTLYDLRIGKGQIGGVPVNDPNGTAEETIVITTSMHYFIRKGGLQSSIHFLYAVGMTLNISSLINSGMADKYADLVDPGKKRKLYKDRLRLDILD